MRAAASGASSNRASVGKSWTPSATLPPKPAFRRSEDFNRGDNEGCGYFHVNQRSGVRWNTSKGFLRPVQHRANLTVLTHAEVRWLTLSGKRVTGVTYEKDGKQVTARAAREVILAAGSIGSPQIMQVSGIGAAAHLKNVGVTVLHDLPGVGENLQDHLQVRCAYKVSGVKTMNERYQSLFQRGKFAAEYALFRRGPMTMAPSQLGAFTRSDPSRETPNIQYPHAAADAAEIRRAARSVPGVHRQRLQSAPDQSRPCPYRCPRCPHRAGDPAELSCHRGRSARGCGCDPCRSPHRRRCRRCRNIGPRSSGPARRLSTMLHLRRPPAISPPPSSIPSAPAKWVRMHRLWSMRDFACTASRASRIADASIMPTITSGNTNAPVL